MKKIFITAAVLGLIAGFTNLTAVQASASDSERGYVSVSASANKELSPDTAEISIAVRTYDSRSMQKATLENKEISDKVYAALKSMLTPANGDYIKTADFNASPEYSYSGSKKNFDRYAVSNRIIVHTKSIDKVGEIIDKAIALGATDVDNLAFSLSDYETQCEEMTALATKKAQKQAANIAQSASTVITGIRSIDGNCSPSNNTRVMYNRLMSAGSSVADMESATPIEVGVVRIYANVNASFYVK